MTIIDYCNALNAKKDTDSDKIKVIMSMLNKMVTIKELAAAINDSEVKARQLVSRIRKKHPIFADHAGRGYKYASKKEALFLKRFEEKTIKMHQKNLKVINDYLGEA